MALECFQRGYRWEFLAYTPTALPLKKWSPVYSLSRRMVEFQSRCGLAGEENPDFTAPIPASNDKITMMIIHNLNFAQVSPNFLQCIRRNHVTRV
jgi:hypothetical protein